MAENDVFEGLGLEDEPETAAPAAPVSPTSSGATSVETAEESEFEHDEDVSPANAEPLKSVPLFQASHGLSGRDGGPYLDDEQRIAQEELNARREGRAPDLDNPALAPSTSLVTEAQLLEAHAGVEGEKFTVDPVISGDDI